RQPARGGDVQEAEHPAARHHREHELLRLSVVQPRGRHLRPRRRGTDGRRSRRAVRRPHSDLSADPRGKRHGRAAARQRAGFARGPRVHGRGGANGRAGVDRELQPADHSSDGGPMTHRSARIPSVPGPRRHETTKVHEEFFVQENLRESSGLRAFVVPAGFLALSLALAAVILAAAAGCAPAPQTSNTPAAGTEMPRSIVDPYPKIQSALADHSVDGVRQNAGNIATAASGLGSPAMKIDMAAVQLTSAGGLADARDKFGRLSEAIDAYMTGLKLTAPEGVRVAVCPMVNKP